MTNKKSITDPRRKRAKKSASLQATPTKKLNETILLFGETTSDDGVGGIDMRNRVLPNLAEPVASTDAATKNYVDTTGGGDVTGAGSSTLNEIVIYASGTGKVLGNSNMFAVKPSTGSNIVGTYTNLNSIGISNTGFGENIFARIDSNSFDNVALGAQAASGSITLDNSVIIGTNTVNEVNATIDNSIIIGTKTAQNINSTKNSVMIDNQSDFLGEDDDNLLTIGGALHGRTRLGNDVGNFTEGVVNAAASGGAGITTITSTTTLPDNFITGTQVIVFETVTALTGNVTSTADNGSGGTTINCDALDNAVVNDARIELDGVDASYDRVWTVFNVDTVGNTFDIILPFTATTSGTYVVLYDGSWEITDVPTSTTFEISTPFTATTAVGKWAIRTPGQLITGMQAKATAGVSHEFNSTTEAIRLNRLSQASEDALTVATNGAFWYNTASLSPRFSDGTNFRYAGSSGAYLVIRELSDFDPFVSGSDIDIPDNTMVLVEALVAMDGFTINCGINVSFFSYLPTCGFVKTADATAIIAFATASDSVTFLDGIVVSNSTASGVTYTIDSALGLFAFNRVALPAGMANITDILGGTYTLSQLGNSMQRLTGTPTNGGTIIILNITSEPSTVTGTFSVAPGVTIDSLSAVDYNVFANIGTNKIIALENASTSIISRGTIDNAKINGTAPFLNFDQTSDNWAFKNVSVNGVETDSFDKGYTELDNAGSYNNIALTQDTFADINTGGTWAVLEMEKFSLTTTTNGLITYNGVVNRTYKFTALFDFERSGVIDVRFEFRVAINGTTQAASKVDFFADNANPFTITAPVFVFELSPGDTIKWQVTNRTNSDDISVAYARHGIYE